MTIREGDVVGEHGDLELIWWSLLPQLVAGNGRCVSPLNFVDLSGHIRIFG